MKTGSLAAQIIIGIAIQRGNVTYIVETVPRKDD